QPRSAPSASMAAPWAPSSAASTATPRSSAWRGPRGALPSTCAAPPTCSFAHEAAPLEPLAFDRNELVGPCFDRAPLFCGQFRKDDFQRTGGALHRPRARGQQDPVIGLGIVDRHALAERVHDA